MADQIQEVDCVMCHGTGRHGIPGAHCSWCDGSGKKKRLAQQPQSEQPSNAHLAVNGSEPVRGETGREAVAYTFGREVDGRMVYISDFYLAAHAQGLKTQLLDAARREGFTGTVDKRLADLGWVIVPLTALTLAGREAPTVQGLMQLVGDYAHATAEAVRAAEGYTTEPDVSSDEWESRRDGIRFAITAYAERLAGYRPGAAEAVSSVDLDEAKGALNAQLPPFEYDPSHPQFVAGFKLGHGLGRKRGIAAAGAAEAKADQPNGGA